MNKDANNVVSSIDDKRLTPKQRTTLESFETEGSKEKHVIRLQATLDLGFDDNINISHDYIDYTTNTLVSDEMGTRYVRLNVDGSYQYNFTDSGGWFLRSDANLFTQYNLDVVSQDTHYYDTLYGRLYAGGGYANNNLSIYVPLFYDRVNYRSVDLYNQIGIRPDFNMQFGKGFVLNVNGTYSKRSYIPKLEQMRDDSILALGAGGYWFIGQHYVYVKVKGEKYEAKDINSVLAGMKVFVNKQWFYGEVGGLYSIRSLFDIRGSMLYGVGNYDEIPLFFGTLKRDDTMKELTLSFERDLMRSLRARVQLHYLDNASNYNQAIFTKHEILIGLIYSY